MRAIKLIQFLLPPRPGRIHCLNSPFDQEEFKLATAATWIARGKAEVVDGILIFHDEFRCAILQQFRDTELQVRGDAAFETMVDLEQSGGTRIDGSFGIWAGRNSGRRAYGGPENRTLQMRRKFRTLAKPK